MNDGQKEEFCKQAMIPQDVSLEIEDFEKFHEARKEILTESMHRRLYREVFILKKALIVGDDEYPNAPLHGCVNDASALAELLKTNGDGT